MTQVRQAVAATAERRVPLHRAAPAHDAWFGSVLLGAQAGAAWAFEELWQHYAGRVRGYLRRQGAEDADDLTSETFLGAFRTIGSFRGDEDAFRSWLFSIAHRRLVDERRRRSRRPRGLPVDGGGLPAVTDGGIEEAVAGLSDSVVERLVRELPRLQRDVLLLRVVAGLPAEEVGRLVGRRAGAVRTIQHRALATLRARLEPGADR